MNASAHILSKKRKSPLECRVALMTVFGDETAALSLYNIIHK